MIQPYLSSACLHIAEIILLILWVILCDFERRPCYWTGPAMVLMMVWLGHLVILPRVIASLRLSCKHGKLFSSHSWAMCHPTYMYVMQLLEQGVM